MKMINADQITTNMNGSTLEIFVDGKLAGRFEMPEAVPGFRYRTAPGNPSSSHGARRKPVPLPAAAAAGQK